MHDSRFLLLKKTNESYKTYVVHNVMQYYNMNIEILDINVLTTGLATMQLNSTSILSPALTSLNQFFAQVVAAIPRVISAAIILLLVI